MNYLRTEARLRGRIRPLSKFAFFMLPLLRSHSPTLLFILAYVCLDAASFIHPLNGLNITPWNPAPALGLVYLLRRGEVGHWHLFLALLLGDWILRGGSQSWLAVIVPTIVLAYSYLGISRFLRQFLLPNSLLDDRHTLLKWLGTILIVPLISGVLYLSLLLIFGLLPSEKWGSGVIRFWVGDAVGITVAMPLFWWLSSERGRLLLRAAFHSRETFAYILAGIGLLAATFLFSNDKGFKLFYFLFLPIIWASSRQGMVGAILSATVMELGIVFAAQWLNYGAVTLSELQILGVAIAIVGFFIGTVVDEQRRASDELRQTLRLAAAGEMAGALAHELNQPLTSLSVYAATCNALLQRNESGERMQLAVAGLLRECQRTSAVVQRLRDFFQTGATRLELISLQSIVEAAAQAYRNKAERQGIDFVIDPLPEVHLWADNVQLQVVVRNLLANAFDAVLNQDNPQTPRRVCLRAEVLTGHRVCVAVEDSGSGLSNDAALRLFEPFQSSKSSGLGLGLVISRAIAETHGGSLWGEVAGYGIFKLVLPIQDVDSHA